MDESLRKHITRRMGPDYVRMAEELGFVYGLIDDGDPVLLSLYCVCCHCRRTFRRGIDRMEWDEMRDKRWFEESFFRDVNQVCEIPYLPPVPVR